MTIALQALPIQWYLDGLVLGAEDAYGCRWIVRSSDGWHGAPKPKTQRTVRGVGPGSFRSVNYRGERIVALTGTTKCPDVASRLAAQDRLAAMAAQPETLYELAVVDQSGQARTAAVELDAKTEVKMPGSPLWFDWQIVLAAPDPLKHAYTWQQPYTDMFTADAGGLDWSGAGADFTAPGLDWGVPGAPNYGQVANFGTARAFPIFQITGPAPGPTIIDRTTGMWAHYADTLNVGDVLTINCGEFPAAGYPPQSCMLNTTTNRRVSLVLATEWPSVGPGEVHVFQLAADSLSAARLSVYLRSAWY